MNDHPLWGAGALIALLVLIIAVVAVFIDKMSLLTGSLLALLAFAFLLGTWRGSPPIA